MKKRKFPLLIIFLLFFVVITSTSYSQTTHTIPNEIKIVMNGKGLKNYYNHINNAYNSKTINITSKDKKKFFKISGSYKDNDGSEIFFDGKAKLTGHLKDHINLKKQISSLSINVKNTNVGGVVKFRLLIPETKEGFNEIFWSLLMEKIGFPSPVRQYIKADINGVKNTYIFEERPEKEFLESISFRESPIIQTDERQWWEGFSARWPFKSIGFTHQMKIRNAGFIKNKISEEIAYRSISPENSQVIPRQGLHQYLANENTQMPNNESTEAYQEIIHPYALHGIPLTNRKFIYDPIYNDYIPIYNDGNVGADVKLGSNHNCKDFDIDKLDKELRAELLLLEASFYDRTSNHINKFNQVYKCIAVNYISLARDKKIRPDKIKPLNIVKKDMTGNASNIFAWVKDDSNKIAYPDVVNIDFEKNQISRLSYDLNKKSWVNKGNESFSNFKKIIRGRDEPQYKSGYPVYDLVEINSIPHRKESFDDLEVNNETINIHVPQNESKYVKLNANNAKINIFLEGSNSKIIFYQSRIADSVINSTTTNPKDESLIARYDLRLITGCNTYIDSEIVNSKLTSNYCSLEDGLNLVRVNGNNLNLEINNAKYDAFDSDFSKINFNHIEVNNAGNDCIDISSGVYNFGTSKLNNCGDKAVSVGEKSYSTFSELEINKANVGLAVKDSSVANISSFHGENLKECMMAYRKKQEFNFAILKYNNNDGNCKITLKNSSKHLKKNICNKIDNNYLFTTCFTDNEIILNIKNNLPKDSEFFMLDENKKISKVDAFNKGCFLSNKCEIKYSIKNQNIQFGLIDSKTNYIYHLTKKITF